MTPSYILRIVGEGGAACRPAADYKTTIVVSRIMEIEAVSLQPLFHYKVIWEWENLTLY